MAKPEKPEQPEKPQKSDIDSALVRQLARLLDETGLTEIEYATDHWRIRVAREARASQLSVLPAAPSVPAPDQSRGPVPAEATPSHERAAEALFDAHHPGAVTSPMVGTAYLSPGQDAPPFVKVGEEVQAGQTLLIVEAMKVMNPVTASRAGRIAKVCVENGAPVEFGAVLMIIE